MDLERTKEARPIRWRGKDGLYDVTLRFAPVEGRMECIGVEVRAVPAHRTVTAVALHSIPLGKLIEKRRKDVSDAVARPATVAAVAAVPQVHTLEIQNAIHAHTAQNVILSTARRGGRPPKYDRAHWEKVARVYVEAYAKNRTPTRAVARRFRVSESAAAKWIAKCRNLGLLPKTTRGKARAVLKGSTAGVKATAGMETSGKVLKREKKR